MKRFKNYILVLSLLINVWFQVQHDLVWTYVEWRVCEKGTKLTGMNINEYEIFNTAPLHIPKVVRFGPINENEYSCRGVK